MGRQSETPALFNPQASRAACQRGTAQDKGASGEDKPFIDESLPHGNSGQCRERADSVGYHPWDIYGGKECKLN